MEIAGLNILQRPEVESLLSPQDFKRLEEFSWKAYGSERFQILFVQLDEHCWEAHWNGACARESFKFCQKSLKALKAADPLVEIRGVTPCANRKALKMARLLGFEPLGFKVDFDGRVCLCSIWKGK